jgi:signal transduction histidine kinase
MFLWVVTALFAAGQGVLLIGAARSQGDVVAPADFIGSLVVAVALASFGGLIALRGDSARYGWLMLGLGASHSAIQLAGLYSLYLVEGGEPLMSVAVWVQDLWMVPYLLAFLLLPALFPDGTPATPRWRLPVRLAAAGWITLITVFALAARPATNVFEEMESGPANPIGFLPVPMGVVQTAWAALVLVSIAIGIGSLVTRWRRADAELRQRFKWMLLSLGLISILVGLNLINALLKETAGVDLGLSVLLSLLLSLALTGQAIALGFAVLRFRLYNVDLVISRTIVYGVLTVVIVATYVGVVVGFGSFLPIEQTSLALMATGLAAVVFAPLRDRLQSWVNRWLFGQRDNPYVVLAEMGRLMADTGTPEEMLQNLTDTVATLLKLPGAAIELEQDGVWTRRAAFGTVADVDDGVVLPLRHQGEMVGRLVVMPRSRHEPLTHRDLVLLEDIAHPAGAIARSVRLTMVLQSARERLVMAREEERRRIRRDLHDGLGPTLASQTFQLDEVLERLSVDPAGAAAIVEILKEQNQQLVADIRRLVYELRPPALDELGVAGALTAHVTQLGRSDPIAIEVRTVPDPLPSLPAAVEVAAYRIVTEAITNTIRHAAASLCTATLEVGAGRLTVSVRDDGTGLGEAPRRGVGLISMRERTEELGGSFETTSPKTGGTVVVATIPLMNGQAQDEVRAPSSGRAGGRSG